MYTYIPIFPLSCASLPPSLSHPSRWSKSTELISLWQCFFFFMAVLGLRFCARAFSNCGKRGPLFIAASLVAEHRLQTRKLSNYGSRAQLLRGMWDFPRPGLEPVSPALAGRLSTTAPPGKPWQCFLRKLFGWTIPVFSGDTSTPNSVPLGF